MPKMIFVLHALISLSVATAISCPDKLDTITAEKPSYLVLDRGDCIFRISVKPSKMILPGSGERDTLHMRIAIKWQGTLKISTSEGVISLPRTYMYESGYDIYSFSGSDTGLVLDAAIIYYSTLPSNDFILKWSDPSNPTRVLQAPVRISSPLTNSGWREFDLLGRHPSFLSVR